MKIHFWFYLTSIICLTPGTVKATSQNEDDTLPETKRLRGPETTRRADLEDSLVEHDPHRGLQDGDVIPGAYIIQLDDDKIGAKEKGRYRAIENFTKQRGIKPDRIYSHAISGFTVKDLPKGLAKFLEADSAVILIEEDRIIRLSQTCAVDGASCFDDADCCSGSCTRGNPSERECIGLDPAPPTNPPTPSPTNPPTPPTTPPPTNPGPSTQEVPYGITRVGGGATYTGSNVAWVLDTGIDLNHEDLNVDASRAYSVFNKPDGGNDRNSHGTHVAGTIAAIDNTYGVVGVAAGATVIPVKVLNDNGSGSNGGVIDGIDYVAANGNPGDVANMSLGGGYSQALNNAIIAAASNDGIFFSLAAGNSDANADNYSPASANGLNVMTISAMDSNDRMASFSNYGPSVDGCQPGVSTLSTIPGNKYARYSGTSMAAPHMAGVMLMTGSASCAFEDHVLHDKDSNADPICIIPN